MHVYFEMPFHAFTYDYVLNWANFVAVIFSKQLNIHS